MADDPTERAKRYRQKAEEITREAQRSTLARSEFLHVARCWEALAEHFESTAKLATLKTPDGTGGNQSDPLRAQSGGVRCNRGRSL